VDVASGELPVSAAAWRRIALAIARVVVPVTVVGGVGLWFEWGRFRMTTPSIIDEWFGVTYSGPALHALLQGNYFSSGLDFGGRYRPAYTAIWNYIQWHVSTGPSLMASAAAWGVVRIALFVVAVWILTVWLLRRDWRSAPLTLWLAPLAVALTPGIADDLARYGPGDPMMVSGLVVGLALIGKGVRRLVLGENDLRGRTVAFAGIGLGYLVYLLGVYSKEASFCLLVFAPFFLKWLAPSIRRHLPSSRVARVLSVTLVVMLLAPLVHMAIRLALALLAGERPYPAPDYSLGRKLFAAVLSPLIGHPGALQTWLWFGAVPVAIAVAVETARRRDRDAWLLIGVLTTGFLMSSVALGRGEIGSWYYIPWIVAVAAVAFQALARTNIGIQLGVAVLIVLMAVSGTRTALAKWSQAERSGSTAVSISKGLLSAGCPVYLANFDIEQRVAIPLLFPYSEGKPAHNCARQSPQAYALSWRNAALPVRFAAGCPTTWRKLAIDQEIATYRCEAFHLTSIPDQNAASGNPLVKVVRLRSSRQIPSPRQLFQSAS